MQRGIKKLDLNFKPSMKTLVRVMQIILERNCIKKTSLSQESNIQYTRLLKHLNWLERKHLVQSIVEDNGIGIKLTSEGREFTKLILTI